MLGALAVVGTDTLQAGEGGGEERLGGRGEARRERGGAGE